MIDPEYYWNDGESLLFHVPKPAGMLLLFASVARALLRGPRAPAEPSVFPPPDGKNS